MVVGGAVQQHQVAVRKRCVVGVVVPVPGVGAAGDDRMVGGAARTADPVVVLQHAGELVLHHPRRRGAHAGGQRVRADRPRRAQRRHLLLVLDQPHFVQYRRQVLDARRRAALPQQAGEPRLPRRGAVERVGVRFLLRPPQRVPTGARPLRRRQRRPDRLHPAQRPRQRLKRNHPIDAGQLPRPLRVVRRQVLALRFHAVPVLVRQEQRRRTVAAVDQQVGMGHLHPAQVEQLVALPKLVMRPRTARPLNQRYGPVPNPVRHPPPPRGERLRRKHPLIHRPLLRSNHVAPLHAHRRRCIPRSRSYVHKVCHARQAVKPAHEVACHRRRRAVVVAWGSRASRRPSPRKLTLSTVREMARPGQMTRSGVRVRNGTPS